MAGREVREYTNLSDPKDKKWGKGKDKLDDEDVAFQRMVAKMQEVAGERGGYLHGRGALDSDDLLYLKEQMEAEEDAERLLRRTEKRAFAAFKKAASLADSSPALSPLPLRVEPKPKSGIRQQDLLKKVVEVKPKRPKFSSPSDRSQSNLHPSGSVLANSRESNQENKNKHTILESNKAEKQNKVENPAKSLLGLAYASSDDED
ncbi:Ankyrin repeat domain-containing protein 50 isoform 3 [Theobroma cacao]|uniref:Ankyrin repeat domain-containing protein 50 isoform 3 n=3 Tax=Theobroma cacao TaxID=3641 RepID=A0A061G3P7_THECC|nr:Ankyrin repeat domain-containing protein 50 isoform 3 [Theobroma cacao]